MIQETGNETVSPIPARDQHSNRYSMSTKPTLATELRDQYAAGSARLQEEFAVSGDGRAAVHGRTALVESITSRLWKEIVSPGAEGPQNFALLALGGFGRRWLFPYSDIDILFLHSDNGADGELKSRIEKFSQEMWDLRLKLSPSTRSLAECEKFDADNVEFAISLLDCRYLAGDRELFARLHDQSIPKLVSRESRSIVQRLTDLTRARYNKFGNSVFHLEPNVKDGPGGLRDYNLAHWLALIAAMEEKAAWPDEAELLPPWLRPRFNAALDFLMSVRCFLHFRHGRDDNTLAWAAQDEAADRTIGVPDADSLTYFRLDAHLLWSRALDPSRRCAAARGISRRAPVALSPVPKFALALIECRVRRRGRPASSSSVKNR